MQSHRRSSPSNALSPTSSSITGTRSSVLSSIGTNSGASPAWPGTTSTASAVSSSAAVSTTLVLSPPRLRPSAWALADRPAPTFFSSAAPRLCFSRRRPGGVLGRRDDGGVNHRPPELAERRIGSHGLEQPPQRAGCRPAAEAVVHGVPAAELGRQVAPGHPGAGQVQERLEEVPIWQPGRLAALVSLGLLDQRLHPRPELVREHVSHDRPACPRLRNLTQAVVRHRPPTSTEPSRHLHRPADRLDNAAGRHLYPVTGKSP